MTAVRILVIAIRYILLLNKTTVKQKEKLKQEKYAGGCYKVTVQITTRKCSKVKY